MLKLKITFMHNRNSLFKLPDRLATSQDMKLSSNSRAKLSGSIQPTEYIKSVANNHRGRK